VASTSDAYDKLVDRMTVKNRIVVRGPGWELEMEEDNTKKLMKAIPKLLRGLRNFTAEDRRLSKCRR